MSSSDLEKFQKTQNNLLKQKTEEQTNSAVDLVQLALDQLGLRVTDPQDRKQITKILSILQYPNSQIASTHHNANRLGNRDIGEQGTSNKKKQQLARSAVYCPCCGFAKQQDEIKLCHNLDDISNLGLSTFLYFQTIKNLSIILFEMLLIYSIFAFATNLIASGKFGDCGKTGYLNCSSNLDYLAISLGSKQKNSTAQNQNFYYIQAWLGVVMVIIWFITFSGLKYYEKKKQLQVDQQTRSASDFTIVLENVPQSFTQAQFQIQLKAYEEKVKGIASIPLSNRKPFNIKKFNKGKPFYLNQSEFNDEQMEKIKQQEKQMRVTFAQWIKERRDSHSFSSTKQQREQLYKKYQQNIEALKVKLTQIGQKIKQKLKQESSKQDTVVFLTLDSDLAKNLIVKLNPTAFSSRIRDFLTCSSGSNRFQLEQGGKAIHIKIQRAPQPQDIIWSNIGLSDCQKLKRKIITFTVTVIMLGGSFVAVYGLSQAQLKNSENRFLSILISVVISLINILISQAIRFLSIYERDYTTIKYQTSLAIKSVLAQLLNSILVPIFANYFIKNNLYDKNGLSDDIFMLGLTNALVAPLLKYFDPNYLILNLMRCFKDRPNSKLYMNQAELNAYNLRMQFQTGYQYIYVVNLYLFVCFFVSLQPIICLFAIMGYFFMFWAQKWSLFNRMRRPIPGSDLINSAMTQVIFLGPIIYSLGSLTWSNFFPDGTPKYAILPNLIALGISVFMWIFPFSIILEYCRQESMSQEQLLYEDNRIYLSTEYDRLNPVTAAQGYKDYMSYIQEFGKKIKGKSKQEQEKMAALFAKNAQKGSMPASGPQNVSFAPGMMNSFFAPPQQPYQMMPQQVMPGFFPSMMPMQPHMQSFQQNTTFSAPAYQQPFMPFQQINSGFRPQNPYTQPPMQAPIQSFQQPIIHQPMFTPQQQNFGGFGNPQQPIGFQQSQPFGFQQQGFQNQGFGQQGFGQPNNPFNNFQ